MGYEDEAQELMKKFKLQYEQAQKQSPDFDLTKIYEKTERKIISSESLEGNNDISKMIQNHNRGSTDQSPPDQSIDGNFINDSIDTQSTDQSPPNQRVDDIIVNNNVIPQSTDQSPPDQRIVINNESANVTHPITPTSPQPIRMPAGGGVCPQCKTIHPPLRPGEKCPNASQDVSKFGLDDTSVNKFIVDLRNIILSQLSLKGIKDGRKFFQFAIIELTKILEEYNE